MRTLNIVRRRSPGPRAVRSSQVTADRETVSHCRLDNLFKGIHSLLVGLHGLVVGIDKESAHGRTGFRCAGREANTGFDTALGGNTQIGPHLGDSGRYMLRK